MSIDHLSPDLRLEYGQLGRQFGSVKVRDHGQRILEAYELYKDIMHRFGWGSARAAEVRSFLALYPANLESRTDLLHAKTQHVATLYAQEKAGREVRLEGRALADVALLSSPFELLADAETQLSRQRLTAVLAATESYKNDPPKLIEQLRYLAKVLNDPLIIAALPEQDVQGLVTRLSSQAQALDTARTTNTTARNTTAETDLLDVIDGAIVTRLRAANKVAKAAAKALGQPAIAKAFAMKPLRG